MPSSKSPAWKRNLAVLSLGQLVTISAMGIVIPLIPFFLRELGMTDPAAIERWSGLVFSGPFLVAAIMSPVWSYLGDRYGHKRMVVRAIVGLAVVNLAMYFVETPLQFFLLRFAQGIVTGFVPAALAITSATTPRGRLPEAMGKLSASSSAGRLLGPAVGGILAGWLAFRQLFLLVGVTIGIAAVFVSLYLEESPRESSNHRTSLTAPFRSALAHPQLRLALPGLLVAMAAVSMTMPIFPLYIERLCDPGVDPKLVTGVGFAVVAGFTLLTSAWLGKLVQRVGLKRLLVSSLTVAAIALVLHPLASGIAGMLVLRALLGVAVAGIGPVLHSMISRAAPEGMRGGTTGLANSSTIFGFFVGPVGGGFLANQFGVDGVFRIAGGIALACAIGAGIVTRRIGTERKIPPILREVPR